MTRSAVATRTVWLAAAAILPSAVPPAAAQASASRRYVAMGSSYAAGPGVGQPDAASGQCARSLSNFARTVAARRRLDLIDVSCSGATTANILDHGQHGAPAQLAAVTPDTAFVSVLIGGNDIDYVGDLGGLTCRDTGGTGCRVVEAGEVEAKMAALPASLDAVVAAIRKRAPAARIMLVGYLPAIPATGPGTCGAVPLSPADAARMRGVAIRLAQIIGGAAARDHVGIVRSTQIGAGHHACASVPYVAGYRPARSTGWPAAVPYHPTQAGMDAVADALGEAFGG